MWSRKPNQIVFEPGVQEYILDITTEMMKNYSSNIPLLGKGGRSPLKIAKGSVSVAGRQFSCDASGNNLVVKKGHVDFYAKFLDAIYRSDETGYFSYSINQMRGTGTQWTSAICGSD